MKLTKNKNSLLLILLILSLPIVLLANETLTFNDQDIADAIKDQYFIDYVIDEDLIEIKVINGTVKLTGKANNILAKERATDIANMVKGVRWVHNNIQIEPPLELSDSKILENVKDSMKNDPATGSYDISISINDNLVTLDGQVQSKPQKQLCEIVAKSVNGVVAVKNNIKINYREDRSDNEIKHDIDETIRWDTQLYDDHINVFVKDGSVIFSGVVDNALEKARASDIAWVYGIKDVDVSKLYISWWNKYNEALNKRDKAKPDIEIKKALEFAMLCDPRVNLFDIECVVKDGVLTLSGIIDNLKAKKVAEELAENTIGIKSIANIIEVKPLNQPSDEEIISNIKSALNINPFTTLLDFSINVKDGVVTLSGEVHSIFEKMEVEEITSKIRGVIKVNNLIKALSSVMCDNEIKNRIETLINWNLSAEKNQIEVEVINGVVFLSGRVESWPEYYNVENIADEGGATSLVNKLIVK